MSGYTADVLLDGVNIDGVTLTTGRITAGSTIPGAPPEPASAYLEVMTSDAADRPEGYPDIGFGSAVPSGFTDTYADAYEGGSSRLVLHAPISIVVRTDSGFIDAYEDAYLGGFESERFSGTITALDYTPSLIGVTAIAAGQALRRARLLTAGWPTEPEVDRVARIAAAVGVPITIEGTSSEVVAGGGTDANLRPAWDVLAEVAAACDGLLYSTRTGQVVYRTRNTDDPDTLPLDPYMSLLDPLRMTQDDADIANVYEVTIPGADGPQTLTYRDEESVARWRERSRTASLNLTPEGAARWGARHLGMTAEPVWRMPSVVARLNLAPARPEFPANVAQLLDLDLDDPVTLPQLLPGSPAESYTARVVGYEERIDPEAWDLEFYLDPYGWTARLAGERPGYIPPPGTGPSKDPILTPHALGQFRVANYDPNLTYTAAPVGGGTEVPVLDPITGIYTVTGFGSWTVATTEDGSKPGGMARQPYTYTTEDRGYWEYRTVTRDESYPARYSQRQIIGDQAVWDGSAWRCPVGWVPVEMVGYPFPVCTTVVEEWTCDYGGTLEGTTCRKVVTTTEATWVPNLVTVRNPTPQGWLDVFGEWVRVG